ncbi:MAG TPA: SagB family peptide dehydrogenase [Anaerolineae bacterium]|nr:SagB family peptide dehydrogenase [Anaerolineae bacterium]
MSTLTFYYSFREDISLVQNKQGQPRLKTPQGNTPLHNLSPGLLAAFNALSHAPCSEEILIAQIKQYDHQPNFAPLFYYLERFQQQNILSRSLMLQDTPFLTIEPISPYNPQTNQTLPVNQNFCLSRFAYLRRDQHLFALASPRAHSRLLLHHWRLGALIQHITTPKSIDDCLEIWGDLPSDWLTFFLNTLFTHQLITLMSTPTETKEDMDNNLVTWHFHELLFHSRSRPGRHIKPTSKTYPFVDRMSPPPAVKPPPTTNTPPIDLPFPDLNQITAQDAPFTTILEQRHSQRQHNPKQPITLDQLGEFLYRTARVRARIPANNFTQYETSNRPYPGGGACYELELYLAINHCQDLERGLYYYHPENHQLYLISSPTPQFESLIVDAMFATVNQTQPQIVINIAARFQRVSWSYEGISYAVTLKNVGAFYQTMYLVATAMGLAACAMGRGNSDTFSQVAGLDYYTETTVGEFMLGTPA